MPEKYPVEKIKEIENEYIKNNIPKAWQIISEIKEKGVKSLKIDELEGLIYLKENKPKLALKKLKLAAEGENFTDYSRLQLADLYICKNLFIEAIDQLKIVEIHQSKEINILLKIADCYLQKKNFKDALTYLIKVSKIDNSIPEVVYNIGRIYDELLNYDEAISYYKRVIKLNPKIAEAYINIGVILQRQKKFRDAIFFYEKAYELNKKISYIIGDIIYCYKSILDFKKYNYYKKKEKDENLFNNIEPFQFLSILDSPEKQMYVAKNYIKSKVKSRTYNNIDKKIKKGNLVKIGYISADFKMHPTSFLIAELIEKHNCDKFEVLLISLSKLNKNDPMTQRYMQSNVKLIDVSEDSSEKIVDNLRNIELDIAIDLMGFTTFAKPELFKNRVAPIQINYLGYPGTMGMDEIDYIVADQNLIPEAQKVFYSEKIMYLPKVFQPYDTKKTIKALPGLEKNDIDLIIKAKKDKKFIYACFNSLHKINEEVLLCWAKILSKSINSILWIAVNNEIAKNNLINFFKSHNIDNNQIVFSGQVTYSTYLENYSHADLFLDTWPFNAGVTCRDAIWAGLPLLTIEGKSFAGRMATSILYAANCKELVTKNSNEYINCAIELAINQSVYAAIKEKIKQAKNGNLFDMDDYTKNLERAYLIAIEINNSNRKPQDIVL